MPPSLKSLPNYYKLLQVPKNASSTQIKTAYYKLAKIHHPDVTKNHQDDTFKKISEAYHILKSPDLRQKYDFELKQEGLRSDTEAHERASQRHQTNHASASDAANDKNHEQFRNQYEYYFYNKRKQYEDPNVEFDYNKHHKYHDSYQQYFHQRNVHNSTQFHNKRTPDGRPAQEEVHHRFDPDTNTHYYYHKSAASGFNDEYAKRVNEDYRNFYNMQGTYDSYERSRNIPSVFGIKLEYFLFAIAVLGILYGIGQQFGTKPYEPYSNVYERDRESRKR